ncbi:type II toxin-antitoxin system RelE/ParE family toxin [Thiovibrio frasassiensis]|uniref:Type II toxin-antitoxin system RelE/ParE family toxin n=1 Tax=Thiovibrio frasassiensis TaxID=2984131 RepID=A0A9X4RMN1_9BACT|nr:type II toxin-antitoxin system RelE/ParE family toxin [Thiovibrio frasassiensis]MDG4476363.1 type II toxin-antitoxin system RelE/ParE family toxin [Thiovibrio frasassiensis]
MMRVIFSPEARREFEEAERYDNRQAPRLGNEFRTEIKEALPRVQTWPLSCPVEQGDIRRLTLSRFPYKLLYSVENDQIYLIAIAHQHRKPEYWIDRTSDQ